MLHLQTQLLTDANKKPEAKYRMASLSMPLSDPLSGFQGHCSLFFDVKNTYLKKTSRGRLVEPYY